MKKAAQIVAEKSNVKPADITQVREDAQGLQHVSFVMACMKFFGRLANQTLPEFNAELKALTPQDRADLAGMFPNVGYSITDAPAS